MTTEHLWHVTVLSNFARAYDKYARRYDKAAIAESTFPNEFYLLRMDELEVGIAKATRLLGRLGIPGNRLLVLETVVRSQELKANTRTGLGRYIERGWIEIDGVSWLGPKDDLQSISLEEAMAQSFQLLDSELLPFEEIRPRSFSVLPIARGCQASCPFCFSEASASADQDQGRLDLEQVADLAREAKERGAERFVITGGGEPGLLRHPLLCDLIRVGAEKLGKAVLITNGHHLAKLDVGKRLAAISDYVKVGLQVLAISRHHHDDGRSSELMSLETDVAAIAETWCENSWAWPELRLRLICVLQQGGVDSMESMESYMDWVVSLGVREVCFKELYVSTSVESYYHRHSANDWSHQHQVPLKLVLDFAAKHALSKVTELPWGAPVFRGLYHGRQVQIAAYTEPSLLWERVNGIARSWNLMVDGTCLVSLEDRNSHIAVEVTA